MKINKPVIEEEQKKNRQIGWRMKAIILLTLFLTIISALFYVYYSTTQQKLQDSIQLQEFSETLEQEKDNCGQVLSQGEGAFGQYEYCTRLLNTFN